MSFGIKRNRLDHLPWRSRYMRHHHFNRETLTLSKTDLLARFMVVLG